VGGKFSGTFGEYYRWFDPKIRIFVTTRTKKARRARTSEKGCEQCGQANRPLQAAHRKPRKEIVRTALGNVPDSHFFPSLDLDEAWEKIREAHRPYPEVLQYLCAECHQAADNPAPRPE
jgi:hypothetical protein